MGLGLDVGYLTAHQLKRKEDNDFKFLPIFRSREVNRTQYIYIYISVYGQTSLGGNEVE